MLTVWTAGRVNWSGWTRWTGGIQRDDGLHRASPAGPVIINVEEFHPQGILPNHNYNIHEVILVDLHV